MSERVYKLLNGSELLVSEEVMGVRQTPDGMPITVDGDYVIDDVLALVDRLRKELEEKEIILTGRQYTINRLKEQNEEIATMGIRQGEQIARLLQSEKKLSKELEETQKESAKWERSFDNADKQYLKKEQEAAKFRKDLEEERKQSAGVRKAMQDVLYYLQRDSVIPAQDILEQYLAMSVGQEGEQS